MACGVVVIEGKEAFNLEPSIVAWVLSGKDRQRLSNDATTLKVGAGSVHRKMLSRNPYRIRQRMDMFIC